MSPFGSPNGWPPPISMVHGAGSARRAPATRSKGRAAAKAFVSRLRSVGYYPARVPMRSRTVATDLGPTRSWLFRQPQVFEAREAAKFANIVDDVHSCTTQALRTTAT